MLQIIITHNHNDKKTRETTNKLAVLQMVIYNGYDERLQRHEKGYCWILMMHTKRKINSAVLFER